MCQVICQLTGTVSVAQSSPLSRAPGASDNPQTDGFGPLLTLGYVDGDALPFRQAHNAGALQRRSCTKISFPP